MMHDFDFNPQLHKGLTDERIAIPKQSSGQAQGKMPRRVKAGAKKTIHYCLKIFLFFIIVIFFNRVSFAQAPPTYSGDDGEKGFRKENIFIGGGINLGFASNTFGIGATPEIGYSITQWLDAGLGFNLNYTSQRADPYYNGNIRQRNFNYGGGPFVRLYPVRFLFVHGQLEANWIKVSLKDFNNGATGSETFQSTSFIAGIGYTQRLVGQSSFYTMIGMDLMRDAYSPYRDYNNTAIPIIRAGFDIYLRPSRQK